MAAVIPARQRHHAAASFEVAALGPLNNNRFNTCAAIASPREAIQPIRRNAIEYIRTAGHGVLAPPRCRAAGLIRLRLAKRNYRHVDFHERRPLGIAFDIAAISALAGNTEVALRIFSGLQARTLDAPKSARLRSMTLACVHRLKTGKSIRPVLDPVAAENEANWRITPVKRPAETGRRKPVSDGSF